MLTQRPTPATAGNLSTHTHAANRTGTMHPMATGQGTLASLKPWLHSDRSVLRPYGRFLQPRGSIIYLFTGGRMVGRTITTSAVTYNNSSI